MTALTYVDDSAPGITRRMLRGHWAYFDADGARITDRDEIDRLNKIGLPPAYGNAWFATRADAHLLATGVDARGRKQYRYHPAFTASRDSRKFERCAEFGRQLPRIRARVEADLAGRKLTYDRAVASVLRLLDGGRIRVGNEAYVRSNKSFGATTLRKRHAKLGRDRITLRFRAKSGKICELRVTDKGLIRFVRQMQDLPGQHLFRYVRDDGELCPIGSGEVNDYIRQVMRGEFTAKDFRTWSASALAFEWLASPASAPGLKPMLAFVAERLGNTPAIARKSYIHPSLIEIATHGAAEFRATLRLPRATQWLTRCERGLLAFLEGLEPQEKAESSAAPSPALAPVGDPILMPRPGKPSASAAFGHSTAGEHRHGQSTG